VTAVIARDLFRVHSTPEGDAAALQGLSLAVEPGEVLAVLGPSGAGKTSLLRILAGTDRPTAGTVRVFGTDLATLAPRALARYRSETVGYVEQRLAAALEPRLPIVDSVALRLWLDAAPRARPRAAALLDEVGLGDRLEARPAELSGGEQQRVAVCAALAHRPRLLLADEPTGELDRAAADVVLALIRDLAREHGTTAIVVSHDPRAADFADRAVRIRDGRVSEERRAGREQIVVARGGWLRLPEELLRRSGIGDRAEARLEDGRIVVAGVSSPGVAAAPEQRPNGAVSARGRVLELRGLSKSYGPRVVLGGLDADVDRGALTVVTGPSGSGKSTLLGLITGLERVDSGSIRLFDRDVARLDRVGWAELRRAHVGYVPQRPVLVPFLSARENVELALRLRGDGTGAAIEALAAVGLADRAEQHVERLSTGEQLRVAIARALAGRPDLLVADEPTSRLDEANALAVGALLGDLAREWGAAVVVASHDAVVVDQADERIPLG
jgi:ABC-type lipoprotein export system ATPase subunit